MQTPFRPGMLTARFGGTVLAGTVLASTVLAAVAALAGPAAASAAATARQQFAPGAARAVFVQTDNLAGNQVVAYHRAAGGALALAGTYPTGGLGGQLGGSVVDHLASQGSLGYDRRPGLLIAVNAGSDTVSVFAASGDRLALRQAACSRSASRSAAAWSTC